MNPLPIFALVLAAAFFAAIAFNTTPIPEPEPPELPDEDGILGSPNKLGFEWLRSVFDDPDWHNPKARYASPGFKVVVLNG